MHTPNYLAQADFEFDYAVDYSRREPAASGRRRRPSYSRRGRQPVMVNGIHRRRHKKIAW